MFDDLKIVTGMIVAAVLSAYLRYRNFARFCSDSVLGFLMGYCFYHILGYFAIDGSVKCGISGMIIIWARPLYDMVNTFVSDKLADILAEGAKK